MRAFAIALLMVSSIGCKKDKETTGGPDPITEKTTFKGTFQRNTTVEGPKVAVSLELGPDHFSNKGGNYPNRYPVIGQGKVETGADHITFADSLAYTADFDWSLILQGRFQVSLEGDSIVFSRDYGNQVKDIYKLKAQPGN